LKIRAAAWGRPYFLQDTITGFCYPHGDQDRVVRLTRNQKGAFMSIEKKSLTGSGLGDKAKTGVRKTAVAKARSSITKLSLANTRVAPRTRTTTGTIKVGSG
jgi:hypothetical protein